MKIEDKKYWSTFTVDSHGYLIEPIKLVEQEVIMNHKHYFDHGVPSKDSYSINSSPYNGFYFTIQCATKTKYFFQKKIDAEKFINDQLPKNIVKFSKE